MNSRKIEATVYLDRSAQHKVIVIPSRIDLTLGTHEIVWRLADREGQKFVGIKFKCGDVKPDKTKHTDDTWTMVLTNNYDDDGAALEYVVTLEYRDTLYSSEPTHGPDTCEPEYCKDGEGVPMSMMSRSGPIIRHYPI